MFFAIDRKLTMLIVHYFFKNFTVNGVLYLYLYKTELLIETSSNQKKSLECLNTTIISQLQELGLLQENYTDKQSDVQLFEQLKVIDQHLDSELSKFVSSFNFKEQLEELHNYNSIKDATQSLLGFLSMQTGVSVTEVHKQFNV